MKKLFFLAACLLGFNYIQAQATSEEAIPAHVDDHFDDNYSHAKDVDWEVMDDGFFEAEFTHDDKEWEIIYDASGAFHSTEVEILYEELPSIIRTKLESNFDGYEILETDEVDQADGTELYEVEMESGDKILELFFNAEGEIVSRTLLSEDGESKD